MLEQQLNIHLTPTNLPQLVIKRFKRGFTTLASNFLLSLNPIFHSHVLKLQMI